MKSRFRFTVVLLTALIVGSCGGGSSDSTPPTPGVPPPPLISPGGIWEGIQILDGESAQVLGLITEFGRLHFIREDGVQFVGAITVTNNVGTGSYEAALPLGTQFDDGSTSGQGEVEFTINPRVSLSGTFTFTSGAGNTANGSFTLQYNPLYDRDSALSTIAGNYTNSEAPGSDALNINSNGVLFYQDPTTNCVANGQVSLIHDDYNAYDIEFTFANCSGQYAVLNDSNFIGIGTLDNTGTPELAIAGMTGSVQGTEVAIIYIYERT